jgi:hypothetical protein
VDKLSHINGFTKRILTHSQTVRDVIETMTR